MHKPTIYRARTVHTLTTESPNGTPDAFAVVAGRIIATGTAVDLRNRFPNADTVDLGDGVVVPGLNDAHMHLMMTAEDLLHLDLSINVIHSLAQLQVRIRSEASARPEGTWIRGSRYDDAKMAEGRLLTRFDLDAAAPRHPVLVVHVAGHWGVVNSEALQRAGIDETTVPPAGGDYGRDAAGRLNGVLVEQALFDFAYPQLSHTGGTVAPVSSLEEKLAGIRRALQMFAAAGLTSLTDALVGPEDIHLLVEARRRGMLPLRVNMLVAAEYYDTLRACGIRDAFGDEWLRIGGVKTFVDGAVGGRTCLLAEPYEGSADDHGIQTRTTAELRDVVRQAHADGMRVCVHANGDRAIDIILGLLEEAQEQQPRPELHHRIEHCTVVTEDILARMRRLGAIAVPFGSYVQYHGGRLLEWYGEGRMRRMFAHRWFLDAGVAVAGSSDYPCGPYEPLLAMQSCVTRRGWDGVVMGGNQRVSPAEALALYTTGSAYTTGQHHAKGRLAPGMLADFTVLGDDPLTHDPESLGAIPVRATYAGGRRVWPEEPEGGAGAA